MVEERYVEERYGIVNYDMEEYSLLPNGCCAALRDFWIAGVVKQPKCWYKIFDNVHYYDFEEYGGHIRAIETHDGISFHKLHSDGSTGEKFLTLKYREKYCCGYQIGEPA